MCDVLIALPDSTKQGNIIFGKNSDRPAGECQVIYFSLGKDAGDGESIRCSHVEVPQISKPLATLGCRPYWCWGYETGLNEAGVVGGNAAIYTRSLYDSRAKKEPGLTGMDLLRLGLERGDTAEKAIEIIIELLEKYGQWGSAVRGVDHEKGSYDNSYLIADKSGAWVLETSGRRWIAEQVQKGILTISNEPTIRSRWTKISPDLKDYARQNEWWNPDTGDFDFAYCLGDHEHYSRQVSHIRWKRTNQLLNQHYGSIDNKAMMKILRDHYEETFLDGPQFSRFLPDFLTVCMHDSLAGFTWGNTATSVAVELDPQSNTPPLFWLAYLPPCSSIYTAFQFSGNIPDVFKRAGKAGLQVANPVTVIGDEFDDESLWWRLHRLVTELATNPRGRYDELKRAFDEIESNHIKQIEQLIKEQTETTGKALVNMQAEHIGEMLKGIEMFERSWGIN